MLSIICQQSEGKLLTSGEPGYAVICVCHIPRHWTRPHEGAPGTRVTFIKSADQFSYSPLLPQTSGHFCLPREQQLWFPTTQERGIRSPLWPLFADYRRESAFPSQAFEETHMGNTSFDNAFHWSDKSPVTGHLYHLFDVFGQKCPQVSHQFQPSSLLTHRRPENRVHPTLSTHLVAAAL